MTNQLLYDSFIRVSFRSSKIKYKNEKEVDFLIFCIFLNEPRTDAHNNARRKPMHRKTRSYFTLFSVFLSLLLTAPAVYAASVGNPDTQGGFGKTSVSLEYDYTNRDMQLKNGSVAEGSTTEALDGINGMKLKTHSAFLVGSMGLHERIDVFAGIGVNKSDIGFDWSYSNGSEHDEIRDGSNLAWKMGVRGKIAEVAGIDIGAMAQYLGYSMDGRFTVNGADLSEMFDAPASYSTDSTVREWQTAITASTEFGRFSPYAGVTYNKTTVKNNTTVNVGSDGESIPSTASLHANARNEDNVGIVVGTGMRLTKNMSATVEGRFVNEKSGTASLSYAF